MNLNLNRRPMRTPSQSASSSIVELNDGLNRDDASHLTAAARATRTTRLNQLGWPIGIATEPHAGPLWCPWDRTCGVIGPQGSGKTLDLLTPALLAAPGAALVTLTKTDDLLLTISARKAENRPCVVLDPFGQADGLPELI